MSLPTGRLISASFFWKNNKQGGLGLTFGPPSFSSEELTRMFTGGAVADYMRNSDLEFGTAIVDSYLLQLEVIASEPQATLQQAVLAAYNIMWLTERGFIPNDEFNGPQFVLAQQSA